MNSREFNKTINACRNKKKTALDVNKLKKLSDETKDKLVLHIVRNRGPVVIELITEKMDRQWLASCGYMYTTEGKDFTFLHTSENGIK